MTNADAALIEACIEQGISSGVRPFIEAVKAERKPPDPLDAFLWAKKETDCASGDGFCARYSTGAHAHCGDLGGPCRNALLDGIAAFVAAGGIT